MKRLLFLVHENFEEIELIVPLDILRRAGVFVELASVSLSRSVRGAHGLILTADVIFDELEGAYIATFDAIAIPGGKGVFDIRGSRLVHSALREFMAKNKLICAICAAPLILKDAGILPAMYTGYPSIVDELPGVSTDKCVVSKNVITANGPGAAFDFGFEIAKALTCEKTVNSLKKGMCCI